MDAVADNAQSTEEKGSSAGQRVPTRASGLRGWGIMDIMANQGRRTSTRAVLLHLAGATSNGPRVKRRTQTFFPSTKTD